MADRPPTADEAAVARLAEAIRRHSKRLRVTGQPLNNDWG